jgi:hypothetical protein
VVEAERGVALFEQAITIEIAIALIESLLAAVLGNDDCVGCEKA